MNARDAINVAGNTHNMCILQYKIKGGALKHRPVQQQLADKWAVRCVESPNVEYVSIIDRDDLRALLM